MRYDSTEITAAFGRVFARRRLVAHLAAAPLLALIALVDWATGAEISISIFYLLPVTLLSWYSNLYGVLIGSLVSAVSWFWADHAAGATYSNDAIPYWNGAVRLGFFALFGVAALRVHTLRARERVLAQTDPLTGLLNRRAFFEALSNELARARRHNHHLMLLFADLDGFKLINDRRGHAEGDRVLQAVAQVLRTSLRASDHCARLGGDEFAALLTETDAAHGQAAVVRLQEALVARFEYGAWPLSVSLGVLACERFEEATPEALLHAADQLMYTAKTQGAGRLESASFEDLTDSGDS